MPCFYKREDNLTLNDYSEGFWSSHLQVFTCGSDFPEVTHLLLEIPLSLQDHLQNHFSTKMFMKTTGRNSRMCLFALSCTSPSSSNKTYVFTWLVLLLQCKFFEDIPLKLFFTEQLAQSRCLTGEKPKRINNV